MEPGPFGGGEIVHRRAITIDTPERLSGAPSKLFVLVFPIRALKRLPCLIMKGEKHQPQRRWEPTLEVFEISGLARVRG
ncbi:hypothetical protein HAV15_004476 [Penicillium sp. str. |nr:hypothetical protein HAV15_004476 [Penicillium sp. str. \